MNSPRRLTIAVLGTLDSKGAEHEFVAQWIRRRRHEALLIDVGTLAAPTVEPDIHRETILSSVPGSPSLPSDRGEAIALMAAVLPTFVAQLVGQKRIDGIISLGGSGGTALATAAMRALPLGFPKVMVSTVASGNVSGYIAEKDIVMFPSIVDVAGLNRVSRGVFARAAAAVCAMAAAKEQLDDRSDAKPLIVASMFGNTTRCVEHARGLFEQSGYEVLVFHATGTGGRTMEGLIQSGIVTGVLDITTTEWADELVGGILSAGPHRLEAAARAGVPAVVAPGCLDMVNFGAPETVPAKFAGRTFYHHNPQITLMRTLAEECAQLGRILAEKVNLSTGPVSVLIPARAISLLSAPGQPFHDPVADQALFDAIRRSLRADIACEVVDLEINDPAFAELCVSRLQASLPVRT